MGTKKVKSGGKVLKTNEKIRQGHLAKTNLSTSEIARAASHARGTARGIADASTEVYTITICSLSARRSGKWKPNEK